MVETGFVRRYTRAAQLAVLVGLLAAPSSTALARSEIIRWEHPDAAQVDGYRVYWGTQPQAMGSHPFFIDVGALTPDAAGVHSFDLEVTDDADVYVVVSAYQQASGLESPFSNEGYRAAPLAASSSSEAVAALPQEPEESITLLAAPGGTTLSSESGTTLSSDSGTTLSSDSDVTSASAVSGSLTETSYQTATGAYVGALAEASLQDAPLATDSIETVTGYEYVGRMLITDPNAAIGVTLESLSTGNDAYSYRLKRSANSGTGDFHFQAHPWGSESRMKCSSLRTGVVPMRHSWYWFRLQISTQANQTGVRAKVWQEETAEPTTWQVSCYDERRDGLTAADAGVWSTGNGSLQHWEDLELLDLVRR
jgi:hypothetical protein